MAVAVHPDSRSECCAEIGNSLGPPRTLKLPVNASNGVGPQVPGFE